VHPLPRTPSLDALRVAGGVANSQSAKSRGGWQLGVARGGEPSLIRLVARYRQQLAKQPENVSNTYRIERDVILARLQLVPTGAVPGEVVRCLGWVSNDRLSRAQGGALKALGEELGWRGFWCRSWFAARASTARRSLAAEDVWPTGGGRCAAA
jgi:hypothetical protein